jgi:hypothetical protein
MPKKKKNEIQGRLVFIVTWNVRMFPCRINVLWTMLLVVLRHLNFEKFSYIHVIHWKVYLTKVLCFHMFMCLVLSRCLVVSCMLLDHSPLLFTSTLLCTLSLSLYVLGCNIFLSFSHPDDCQTIGRQGTAKALVMC